MQLNTILEGLYETDPEETIKQVGSRQNRASISFRS
jgi:hypothetical protein